MTDGFASSWRLELHRWRRKVAPCTVSECMLCGELDCPFGEPLHYHHDGCPACEQYESFLKQRAAAIRAHLRRAE